MFKWWALIHLVMVLICVLVISQNNNTKVTLAQVNILWACLFVMRNLDIDLTSKHRLIDSLVVECWHRVLEVLGSISNQWPRHTKVVLKWYQYYLACPNIKPHRHLHVRYTVQIRRWNNFYRICFSSMTQLWNRLIQCKIALSVTLSPFLIKSSTLQQLLISNISASPNCYHSFH